MAFFGKKKEIPARPVDEVHRAAGRWPSRKTVEENVERLPRVRPPHEGRGARAHRACCSTRAPSSPSARTSSPRDVLRFSDGPRPTRRSSRARRGEGRGRARARSAGRGTHGGPRRRDRRPRLLLPRRLHGRGGGGARRARRRGRARAPRAAARRVVSSGGARMHEGALSLMQMAKTSARDRAAARGRALPYITHPRRPLHRRRLGLVRGAGRRHDRGAGRADRLRRPPRHREHDQHDAARGLPARRVPRSRTASSTASSTAASCATS